MGRHSSIDSLPRGVRRWSERALTESNFTDYAGLESLSKGKGCSVTRSSLQRSGYEMEQQLARAQAATEAVRSLVQEAGNDPGDRSAGLITLVQTEVTDILMRLQGSRGNDDPFVWAKLPVTASKNIATLTHASVNLKRYRAEVRERVGRAVATAERIAHRGELSAEAVQVLHRGILRVVS